MRHLVFGALWGVTAFWLGASFMVRGSGVPDWWLPVALGIGLVLAERQGAMREAEDGKPLPVWMRMLLVAIVTLGFLATFHGAVATPSRHWDGAASFDAKVFWLTESPTLEQPFFAEPGVFHHSPDYPILQALLVASTERLVPGFGRAVLPVLYLLLCGLVFVGLGGRGVRPLIRAGVTAAVAVTPALLRPGAGAVDSGYHDVLLLVTTTCIGVGLLTSRSLPFALGIGLAVVSKPEGLVYALGALAIVMARMERRPMWLGYGALGLALWTWEPVRAQLLHGEAGGGGLRWLLPILAVFLGASVWAFGRFLIPVWGRWLYLVSWPVAGLLALPALASSIELGNGAIDVYLRQSDRVWEGLANLPAWALGLFTNGVVSLRFGTAFLLPIVAALLVRWRRVPWTDGGAFAWVVLGMGMTALPFVLSPEPDLEHHLRSSQSRLLLHWLGPAWLLGGAWLDRALGSREQPVAP